LKRIAIALASFALLALGTSEFRAAAEERVIEIHAKRFAFEPAEITVKKGETVKLSLVSDDVAHSLLISEVGINAAMTKGHPTTVEITPDKVGDFPGRCGKFCGSGHGSMRFVLHVTGQ
jgi:cytochrome c oxidase subunit 2